MNADRELSPAGREAMEKVIASTGYERTEQERVWRSAIAYAEQQREAWDNDPEHPQFDAGWQAGYERGKFQAEQRHVEPAEHEHHWAPTGRLDTGTGRREWECDAHMSVRLPCGERSWTDDPEGPEREVAPPAEQRHVEQQADRTITLTAHEIEQLRGGRGSVNRDGVHVYFD